MTISKLIAGHHRCRSVAKFRSAAVTQQASRDASSLGNGAPSKGLSARCRL